jgi:hypothetical protein
VVLEEPLHPALAELKLAHRQVLTQFAAGRLSAEQTRAQLSELVARDDDGVIWTLDASGTWLRRRRDGQWVPGRPPAYGLRPPTPAELGGQEVANSGIYLAPVDEIAMRPLGSLVGSARQPGAGDDATSSSRRRLVDSLRLLLMVEKVLASRQAFLKYQLTCWMRLRRPGRGKQI